MKYPRRSTGAFACAFVALVIHFSAAAADITVLSSNAMTETMKELTPQFEKLTGHKLVGVYEPTNLILQRLTRGEAADVVILLKPNLNDLIKRNGVREGTAVDVAKTGLSLAMKSGGIRPDISTKESFRKAMLEAQSIVISKVGASGIQFKRALESLDVLQQVQPRIQEMDGAGRVGGYVVDGRAQYAVQLRSELLPVQGVEVIGPLPGDLNFEIVLTAAVSANAKNEGPAAELIQFLSAPTVAPTYRKTGMEPL
jgi:molybdate transport system substrate-binding protein